MSLPGGAISVKPDGNGKGGGPSDGGQLWYWYAITRFTLRMRNRCFIQAGKYLGTLSLSSPIGMSVASIFSYMFFLLCSQSSVYDLQSNMYHQHLVCRRQYRGGSGPLEDFHSFKRVTWYFSMISSGPLSTPVPLLQYSLVLSRLEQGYRCTANNYVAAPLAPYWLLDTFA